MAEPADVGSAVGPRLVANRHLDDLELQPRCSEEEIEIAERVAAGELRAKAEQTLPVPPAEDLGAAERVFELLAEDEGEGDGEEAIRDQVQEAHRPFVQGVDQAGAVDELSFSGPSGLVELG